MDLLPELEQSSMIGDIHGVTVGIYKCRSLVGKIIPMKYDIYYICGVFLWTVPSTPQIIAVLKKEHDDKPVDIGESYFWTSHKTSFTLHPSNWLISPCCTSQGIGWDRISANITPQELGVSHELFASPLILGYALAYMVPWAMLGSL